jgi:hypothetical protein
MVLAALAFVISLGVLNVDAFIVRQNVQREVRGLGDDPAAQEHPELDAQYFLNLSDDAVPALVEAFADKSMSVDVREKLGAALVCKRHERLTSQDAPWQAFHISRYLADLRFQAIEQELASYTLVETDRSLNVKTPGGEEFSCWAYLSD